MPNLQVYLLLSIIILFISWIGYIFLNKLIELFKMREGFFDASGNTIDPSGNMAWEPHKPYQPDASGNEVKPYQQESYIKSTKFFDDNIYHANECTVKNAKKLFELKKRGADIEYVYYEPRLYDLNGYPIKDVNSCFIKTKKGAKIFNTNKCQVEPSSNICVMSYK